jgi:hypothetical protein
MKFEFFTNFLFKDKDIPTWFTAILEFPGLILIPFVILFFLSPLVFEDLKELCWSKKTILIILGIFALGFGWHYVTGGYLGLKGMHQINDMGVKINA